MRPDEPLDEFEIDLAPIWPDEDGYLEPIFLPGPLWVEFEDFEPIDATLGQGAAGAPLLVGFEDLAQRDPEPAADDLDEPDEPPPAPRQRASAIGLLGSVGVHLATLLVLIGWSSTPAELAGAIPVQLVIEQAAPVPDAAPPGEAAAESVGEAPKEAAAPPPAAAPPVRPPPTKVATATPPAKPAPAPPAKSAPAPPPTPTPKPVQAQATVPPKPVPSPTPTPAPAPAPAPPPTPRSAPAPTQLAAAALPTAAPTASAVTAAVASPASREAPVAASATGRGDYLNQLVVLTRGHLNILPLSFLAGRRGQTTLSVLVLEDGTISRISVKSSSGYPEIDAKIEQMVAAVGRFPPVPAALPHPAVELDFDMSFPDSLQQ